MAKKKDPPIYALSRASRCFGCDKKLLQNELVKLEHDTEEREVFCIACAGLKDMLVLPSGNAALTRLVKKYSSTLFVIMKWSDLWKCYERQGLLVEKAAMERAKKELSLP